jgi:cell division protein FtsW (lipid II flippase)
MTFNKELFITGMVAIGVMGLLILVLSRLHYERVRKSTPRWVMLVVSVLLVLGMPLMGAVSVNENQHIVIAGLLPIALVLAVVLNVHSGLITRAERQMGYIDSGQEDQESRN